MSYSIPYLKQAHKFSSNHGPEIKSGNLCGCFHCLATFTPDQIEEWIEDKRETAVCPKCGIDMILGTESGYPIEKKDFLEAMHKMWCEG